MKIENELPEIKKNVLLKNYTTFKIGGLSQYFFVAKTKEDLIKAIKVAKKLKLPFFILGGGSNILISDKKFKGLVIKIQNSKFKIQNYNSKFKIIYAEAGVPLALIISEAAKNNLTGLEWAVGIPGTVGGAIWGNAGAFNKSMADIVKKVEVLEVKNEKCKVKNFKNKDCKFDYRESVFKRNPNLLILSAILKLKKEQKNKIKEKMGKFLNYRKKTQPLNFPSAGSVFKNPAGFSAGELIQKCELKGKRVGNVKISELHANFIVNLGGGKAKDVKKLIKLIKKEVKNKFNVKLEEEIHYLGF